MPAPRANPSAPTHVSCGWPWPTRTHGCWCWWSAKPLARRTSRCWYPRETNPELAKTDAIAFSHVTSCGTSTEVSVPCMFSPYGREHYDERRIHNSEGLLDVLVHAGYTVKWLDNQSGCKGVCKGAGVQYEKLEPATAPDLCDSTECHDEILVRRLDAELAQVDRNTVFVLHM